MVSGYQNGQKKPYESLIEAFGFLKRPYPVVSVVGAGGKTTLIQKMQQEYYHRGIPSIMTTTTHIQRQEVPWLLEDGTLEMVQEKLAWEGRLLLGGKESGEKLCACKGELLEQCLGLGVPVLIEADGAKGMPFKVPRAWEPVILPWTTDVVAVYGMDVLGKTVRDGCFAWETVSGFLGKKGGEQVDALDIVKAAASPLGGRKSVSDSMRYHVVLNKSEFLGSEDERLIAENLIQRKIRGLTSVVVHQRAA